MQTAAGFIDPATILEKRPAFVSVAAIVADHPKKSPRVLIIEDKPDATRLALHEEINKNLADQVEMITDGQKAWDRLNDPEEEAGELVAVLLDLKLTSLSGLEVLKRIRAHPRLEHLHVVVMTDSTSDEDMKRCIELGVTSFIQKPITVASFTKAVADSFHDSRAAQRARAS